MAVLPLLSLDMILSSLLAMLCSFARDDEMGRVQDWSLFGVGQPHSRCCGHISGACCGSIAFSELGYDAVFSCVNCVDMLEMTRRAVCRTRGHSASPIFTPGFVPTFSEHVVAVFHFQSLDSIMSSLLAILCGSARDDETGCVQD